MKKPTIPEEEQLNALSTGSCSRLVLAYKPRDLPASSLSFTDYITVPKEAFASYFKMNTQRYISIGAIREGYSLIESKDSCSLILSEQGNIFKKQDFALKDDAIDHMIAMLWNLAKTQLNNPRRLSLGENN